MPVPLFRFHAFKVPKPYIRLRSTEKPGSNHAREFAAAGFGFQYSRLLGILKGSHRVLHMVLLCPHLHERIRLSNEVLLVQILSLYYMHSQKPNIPKAQTIQYGCE